MSGGFFWGGSFGNPKQNVTRKYLSAPEFMKAADLRILVRLLDSMPDRITALIAAVGGHTRYWIIFVY